MDKIESFLGGIPTAVYGACSALAVVCLIGAGLMLMGGERSREKGKSQFFWVLCGLGVVLLAPALVNWLFSFING